ncbi:hypothetical protein D3C72_1139340 [compost metagenome]
MGGECIDADVALGSVREQRMRTFRVFVHHGRGHVLLQAIGQALQALLGRGMTDRCRRLCCPAGIEFNKRHGLADDVGQVDAERSRCLPWPETRAQHLRTGRQLRMCGGTVGTYHEQRAITPEDIHAAIRQHGDAAAGVGRQLALPELAELATQRRRRQVFLVGRAGASESGRFTHAPLWQSDAGKREARHEAGLHWRMGERSHASYTH